jgi:hypothetical protein
MFLPASLVSPSIIEKARRLDQTWYIGDDFLVNYNLKVLACDSNLYYPSATEYGEHEYGAIMFRLCPTSGECSDDVGEESCTAGYGEYLVGLKDFVQEYLQLNREEMIQNDDDSFQMDQLGGCRQYTADIESNYAEWEFYIGPRVPQMEPGSAWHCSSTNIVTLRKTRLPLQTFLLAGRYRTRMGVWLRNIASRATASTTMV